MTRAGFPATKVFVSTSLVTTLPAPTIEPDLIVTPGKIILLAPIQHPFSTIIGLHIVVPCLLEASPKLCVTVMKLTSGPIATSSPK